MDWKATAGEVLLVGIPGAELDEATRERLVDLAPAGVTIFRRNLDTPERWAELRARLEQALPPAPLLAIDQEGGRVSRLAPWIGPTPTAETLGRLGPDAAQGFGRLTGEVLRALGFNLDFAPVVDLCAASVGNGIGDRSFGVDPFEVARVADAFVDGLQSVGVAGCLKHFPGLGDTCVDSHVELPVVERDVDALAADAWVPFATIGERAATVMVGHGSYPALEGAAGIPASLSHRVVRETLRERLGFGGLVVTDDLEMGAVAPLDRQGSAAVDAVAAGCDLALYCADLDAATAARDALAVAARADDRFAGRLGDAATAVRRAATRWPSHPTDLDAWERARDRLAKWSAAAVDRA